jgi:C4-dicarboxylate transporter DctM subunit
MSPFDVGIISLIVLFILLLSRMPIGVVMGLVGIGGFMYLKGFPAAVGLLKMVPYSTFASYTLTVIPMFILMGEFCFFADISKDLYKTVHDWIGHLRGGLAMATVGACAFFAAISGSSLATAATMGSVALPEMRRYRYANSLATGAIAAGGTIGILIPPSVALLIYGILTEQSIGKLFIAGFIPGVLQAIFYMVAIYITCRLDPSIGPPGPRVSLKGKMSSLKNAWIVLALFVLVIGGLYIGIFSPTEAAGVGAFGAFLFGVFRGRLKWPNFKESLYETLRSTAMIFLIVMGAMFLSYFLAVTRLPYQLSQGIAEANVSPYVVLLFVIILYLILGCLMDAMAMMLLTVPILYPIVTSVGFDPIWFGVMVTRMCEIGMITPPVGLNVYIIHGIARDVPMRTIFEGIVPFLIADILHVGLLIGFPILATFLPSFMTY